MTLPAQISGLLANKGVIAALIAAVSGGLGWLGQQIFGYLKRRHAGHKQRQAKLQELQSLLQESKSLFLSQNAQARRLIDLLTANHPDRVQAGLGFDQTFYELYPVFTEEEKELHALIRGMTQTPLRRVNERMSQWLEKNSKLKIADKRDPQLSELARELCHLELHLHEWHNKYESLFAIDKTGQRSLVYLEDEKEHGHGFPHNLEPVLQRIIETTN